MKQHLSYDRLDSALARTRAFGFDAVKFTQHFGTCRSERWVIPELNCLVITNSIFVDKDPRPSTMTETLSLTQGEPDRQYFAIPTTFRERSPSQIDAETLRRYPAEAVPERTGILARADRLYYRSNGPQRQLLSSACGVYFASRALHLRPLQTQARLGLQTSFDPSTNQ